MGHSQQEKILSRKKILTAASQRIREEGLDGFSIADVMNDAELTHGGFYGHFSSRGELVAAALDDALYGEAWVDNEAPGLSLKAIVNAYLSTAHRDSPGKGCAISALGSEIARADEKTRSLIDAYLSQQQGTMSKAIDGSNNNPLATPLACTMIGALTLSRLISDEETSNEVLKQAREFVLSIAKPKS